MLGRIKENLSKREGNEAFEESSAAEIQEQNTSVDHQESTPSREEPDSRQPQDRGLYLMSSSGTSLDGRSFLVPMDREFDDVSSINTAQYGFGHEMRIIGSTEDEEKGDYGSPFEEIPLGEGQRKQQPSFEYHSAYPKRDEKSMGTSGSYDVGCLPLWITDAPRWLKVVIVLSTAILVGAIVLIGVGAALAVQKNKAETLQVSPPIPASPTQPVTNPPATAPTIDVGNAPFSPAPSKGNDDEQGTSTAPSAAAPSRPTTIPEGNMSSQAPAKSSVSFLVTGGRFTGDALAALPQQLKSLPQSDGNTVMFHLGDWNSPFATSCVEQSYQENVNLYSNSAVPVYFVPGDNEYNGTISSFDIALCLHANNVLTLFTLDRLSEPRTSFCILEGISVGL